ncbi:hypothetical protein [Pontibacillus salipaludis]|uniref:hypothetical protein n=1 Tax=Pontibacillus salipaludis TaxID=1697394 RepID=UPI0031EFE314
MAINLEEYRRECIDAQKVFDYVILNAGGTTAGLDVTLLGGLTPAVLCPILNTAGNVIANVSVSIDTSECGEISAANRPNQEVELDNGEIVTLQWVTLEKGDIDLTISFDILSAAGVLLQAVTGTVTIPAGTVAPETVLLCAPEGTTVQCDVLPSSTFTAFNFVCDETTGLTIDLRYNLCQSVQTYDIVKLEVLARLCRPRDIILPEETCEPIVPQQCPLIFPGPDMNGGTGA